MLGAPAPNPPGNERKRQAARGSVGAVGLPCFSIGQLHTEKQPGCGAGGQWSLVQGVWVIGSLLRAETFCLQS